MNACLCKRPRTGVPRCRDPQVGVEDGNLYCGTAYALTAALEAGSITVGDSVDAPAIVKAMRAVGWRVEPPIRRRA